MSCFGCGGLWVYFETVMELHELKPSGEQNSQRYCFRAAQDSQGVSLPQPPNPQLTRPEWCTPVFVTRLGFTISRAGWRVNLPPSFFFYLFFF